jgi:hypothetical protein
MSKFALMPIVENLEPMTPAVMYEVVAAKYLMLGIADFRKLVNQGVIPCRHHPGRKRRIYLKADLDKYLMKLPRSNIRHCEVSPSPKEKGA